jgi:predicted phosphodiesterase
MLGGYISYLFWKQPNTNISMNRRQFLQLSCSSIFVIGTSDITHIADSQFSFTGKKEVKLRFAIASDTHYGQKGTSYELMLKELVEWWKHEKNHKLLDLAFLNGDIVHDQPEYLSLMREKLGLVQNPVYVAHGNHDMVEEEAWIKIFGTPWNYSFRKKDTSFLILNTADSNGKYTCPEIDWVRQELKKHARSRVLFVIMHITPVKWTGGGMDCPELVKLFSAQKNLKAVFHGHDHNEDAWKIRDNKLYFFDARAGGSWGTPYRGYRIVEVLYSGKIVTYQVNAVDQQVINNKHL